ncbi:Cytochrome P450 4C1 [Blattella germanica]|nr:Cytochrome P450 4C1 [Blattella germanica]
MAFLILLLIILISLLVIKHNFSKKRFYEAAETIPGPRSFPIVGNILSEISNSVVERFARQNSLFKEYGATYRLWMGPTLKIFTSDPTVVERIFGSNKYYLERDHFHQSVLSPLLRNGLLTSNGEKWKRHRKVIISTFHTKILETFIGNFAKNSKILTDRLAEVADGSSFDCYKYMAMCALDIICETSMGVPVNAQLDGDNQYVKNTMRGIDLMIQRTMKPWLFSDTLYNLSELGKEQRNITRFINSFCSNVIRKKLEVFSEAGLARREDDFVEIPVGNKLAFLDLLISNSLMNEEEMLDEVATLIFAGYETTATTSSYVLTMLGEYQQVQDKLFEEQKKVIKETMRLYSPVPSTSRTIDKVVEIENRFTIPAGSVFMLSIFCLHRNSKYYPDPESFDPERFSPENSKVRHPYAYMPFGGGRRKCVGYKYAFLEVKAMVSTVIRRLQILKNEGAVDEMKKTFENGVVMKPSVGFNIRLIQRDSRTGRVMLKC